MMFIDRNNGVHKSRLGAILNTNTDKNVNNIGLLKNPEVKEEVVDNSHILPTPLTNDDNEITGLFISDECIATSKYIHIHKEERIIQLLDETYGITLTAKINEGINLDLSNDRPVLTGAVLFSF